MYRFPCIFKGLFEGRRIKKSFSGLPLPSWCTSIFAVESQCEKAMANCYRFLIEIRQMWFLQIIAILRTNEIASTLDVLVIVGELSK